jgi:LemA protein
MNKIWIPLVGLGLVAIVGFSCVGSYNGLVSSQEEVDQAWSEVENQLQRRADLIPNLVETVKGFAAQEKEIFTAVAEARSKLLAAKGPAETAQAAQGMESALGRLLAISERYPDLKSNTNFIRLQDELAGTENRVAVARKRYNDAVAVFNKKTKRFPTSIMAGMFGFDTRDYFQAEASAKDVPKVQF